MLRADFFLAARDFGGGSAALAILMPESAAEGDGKSALALPVVSSSGRAISAARDAMFGCREDRACVPEGTAVATNSGLRGEEDAWAVVEAGSCSPAKCKYTPRVETAASPHRRAAIAPDLRRLRMIGRQAIFAPMINPWLRPGNESP
jgi:hypothetical protein